MGRRKGPDEVFCTACGARIKEAAELCPECGVRNRPAGSAGSGAGASSSTDRTGAGTSTGAGTGTRKGQGAPTISDSWWYGVAICLGLWIVLLVGISAESGPVASATGGFFIMVAWIGLPLTAYYDMKYVRQHSEWQPSAGLWVLGLLVWLVNVVLAAIYLYRRHDVLDVP